MFLDRYEKRGVQIDVEGEIENQVPWSTNVFERSTQVLQDEVSGDQGVPTEICQVFDAPATVLGDEGFPRLFLTSLATSG